MLSAKLINTKLPKKFNQNTRRNFAVGVPLTDFIQGVEYKQLGQLAEPTFKSSTLDNGLKVVTLDGNHPVSSVGLFINSGSRYEDPTNTGASFFLRHLAFKSTQNLTQLRLIRNIEGLNATYDVTCAREYMQFSSQVPTENVPEMTSILLQGFVPRLVHWEVRDEVHNVHEAAKNVESNPRALLFELLHQEAYRNKGLGQSLYAPLYNIHNLNESVLGAFVARSYQPQGSVLVATGGVDHEKLKEVVKKAMPNIQSSTRVKVSPSVYVGGDARVPADCDAHIALAFNGASLGSRDHTALSILKAILGTASTYGNYAIGQGVSGRLNRIVLSKFSFLNETSAFNFSYSDAGLFGVFAVAKKGFVGNTVDALTEALNNLANQPISADELNRAKAVVKGELLIGNEPRLALTEFVGQNALINTPVQGLPSDIAKTVDTVSAADISNLAKKMFKSKPTLVVLGDVENTPTVDKIQAAFK